MENQDPTHTESQILPEPLAVAIAECQAGQKQSFVVLYDAFVQKIYNFLFFRTLHKELAEDLTSQAFIKAFEKIHTFDLERGTFQAWLYQIARNLLIDEFRKRKPVDNIDAHENLRSETNLETEMQAQQDRETLQQLLAELSEESRELVTMRLWDELPYAEIAVITGKTEGSLKMQFSRIIAKLQEHATLLIFAIFILTRS